MHPSPPRGILYLGCPVWACADWRGSLYTADAARDDWLGQYAQVFKTVEGNSTFYGLPAAASVRRWAASVPDGFRFCFKFPREVTHDRKLVDAAAATMAFLERMDLLHGRLGPLLLQLGPNFAARDLTALDAYLDGIGRARPICVEVRHPDFYDDGAGEHALDVLLGNHGALRGNFDTADVFAVAADDETTVISQSRKPRVPRRATVTGGSAFVRFVGRNRVDDSAPALAFWVGQVSAWLAAGIDVHFFTHTPDDAHAPSLARLFHRLLAAHDPLLPPLPPFPGETVRAALPAQASLF
jgi:uncharacterized protein YecE (DUF72 family)